MSARPSGTVDQEVEQYFDTTFFKKLEQHYKNIDAIF